MKKYRFVYLGLILCVLTSPVYADVDVCLNTGYRNYSLIVQRLVNLETLSDGFASPISIGTGSTYNGNTIQGIVISSPSTTGGSRPSVVITGAIHANEWIGAEVAIGLAEYLIENRIKEDSVFGPKNMSIKKLLENIRVIIIPVLNPDGYEYSRAGQPDLQINAIDETWKLSNGTGPQYRDWRKNRRQLAGYQADMRRVGVDINRNFPIFFNVPPVNDFDPANDPGNKHPDNPLNYLAYRGTDGNPEFETNAIISLFMQENVAASIDYHSGKTLVLYPWAHDANEISDDHKFLRPNTNVKDKALFKVIGKKIANIIGYSENDVGHLYNPPDAVNSGTARDWAYKQVYSASFNIELSEDYQPDNISDICNSNIKGALWLMFWAADQGFRKSPEKQLLQ